jgi:hypothetical protein
MITATIRLAIAVGSIASAAAVSGQPVYRCGSAYGHQPCAQGKAIESDDARTAEQREQALRVASAAKRQGDEMERARLQREAALKPALASALSTAPAPAATSGSAAPKRLPKKGVAKARPVSKQLVAFVPRAKGGNNR